MTKALVDSLARAEDNSEDIDLTMNCLMQIQQYVNAKFFSGQNESQILEVFSQIWKFLLFAANNNTVSVRLATYKTAGLFLLKNTPFFAKEVTKSFSETATQTTIEIKSSIILASSFAFICNLIPESNLKDFIENTPIFHHFTVVDPVFSDHLSTVISKLKRLELNWMRSLLLSYLDVLDPQSERYLFKSISACVKNFKHKLMPEVLNYVYKQENPSIHLPLLSYIFTAVPMNTNELDLARLAEIIYNVLTDKKEHEQAIIDSSFHILSLQSNSFKTVFKEVNSNTLELTIETNKILNCKINYTKYNFMPSFYKMKLPFDMLVPKQNDAVMIIPAKIITLGTLATQNQTEYLNILDSFITDKFDDRSDAACTSLSNCINKLEITNQLAHLFTKIVFAKQTSWFHSLSILKLIKAASISTVISLIGAAKINDIVSLIIELCYNLNDNVSSKSLQVLVKFIRDEDVSLVCNKLMQNLDLTESMNFATSFKILTELKKFHPHADDPSMVAMVDIACEYLSMFRSDFATAIVLMEFLSLCDLSNARPSLVSEVFYIVSSISYASLEFYSGLVTSKADTFYINLVNSDISSKNVDIISGNALNYDSFLAPLLASLKLLLNIPRLFSMASVVTNIARQVVKIAPYESSLLFIKYWDDLQTQDKQSALLMLPSFIKLSNSKPTVANWCTLMIAFITERQISHELTETRDCLGELSDNFLNQQDKLTDEELTAFIAYRSVFYYDKERIEKLISTLDEERKQNVADIMSKRDSKIYMKFFEDKELPTPRNEKISQETINNNEKAKLNIDYNADYSKDYTSDMNSPLIIVQMKQNLFDFNEDFLNSLYVEYCREDREKDFGILLDYCSKKNIKLKIHNACIPHKFDLMMINYLHDVNSPDLEEFAFKVMKQTKSREVSILVSKIFPEKFIEDVTNNTRKRSIVIASMAVQENLDLPEDKLMNIVNEEIKREDTSTKRFCTTILLSLLLLNNLRGVPQIFIHNVMEKLETKTDIPLDFISRFYYYYSTKFALTPDLQDTIQLMIPSLPVSSTPILYYISSLMNADHAACSSQYYSILSQGSLDSDIPSVISQDIKMIELIIDNATEQRIEQTLKDTLFRIIQVHIRLNFNPIVVVNFTSFISKVLSKSEYTSYYRTICREFSTYFPLPQNPAVFDMIKILPQIASAAESGFDIIRRLSEYQQKLITFPLNDVLVQGVLDLMEAEINRSSHDVDVVLSISNKFIQNYQGFEDYTNISIVYKMMKFLFDNLSSNDALLVICTNLYNIIPRFEIFFISLTKVLYERNDENDFIQASAWLCGVIRIRCHKAAAACINEKSKLRTLIKLSSFSEDCPESDQILLKL
ncbi:hypothetical protein TVAG_237050 [Trichomonas vaginalis G3]|uniref:Uncharacterized protein n=1 Tax=Trichomonas vaginalis (strain ATCC PRA-98 / G3) TaxID=412133 RepID=A2DCQ5_TRIV3|nr:hypothetical protein TVAGG3_0607320 [Trichomonas vaginalis G3]EAY21679.1 hypothetical protein TVAG_237050 [Trichomonas vaginalis G3]KAI5524342.1 hypothetical protein TVAGG3_0607320 [Trichomonas vaginalis G3]|eukprot:XP_001582665.1 hypothetical protein [Trichomonas vaginalis G3]